jgi:hypothetical protein
MVKNTKYATKTPKQLSNFARLRTCMRPAKHTYPYRRLWYRLEQDFPAGLAPDPGQQTRVVPLLHGSLYYKAPINKNDNIFVIKIKIIIKLQNTIFDDNKKLPARMF